MHLSYFIAIPKTPKGPHTQVSERLYPLRDLQTLLVINHNLFSPHPRPCLLLLIATSFPQVALERNKHQLHSLTVLRYFTNPLRFDILERVFRVDAEAEHYRMGVIVGEGTEAVEFFLAGRVPEGEFDVDVVDEDVCG